MSFARVAPVRTARLLIGATLLVTTSCSSNSSPSVISSGAIDASAPANSAGSPTPDMKPIAWGPCADKAATNTSLQCATVQVPLDYTAPGGTTVDLALVRLPASGTRTGAVLFNPGGPGGSGFDFVAQEGESIVQGLGLTDFDLIGFDPRGVDRSNGLRCQTDADIDKYQFLDDTPDTPEEQRLLDESTTAFEQACTAKYADTLRFYSTDNTAQDMDAIRAALGDDTISFLGVSYGTYLGATYATMFPSRVRAMVLDSAFEPTGDTVEQQYTTQLVGFEHAFDDWATWCQGTDECAFRTADVPAAWDTLIQQLDDHPLANTDGRIGNQAVMQLATIAALYSKTQWPVLGAALAKARDGDPSGIFDLADSYNERHPDGTYDTIGQSNPIIVCASGLEPAIPPDPVALIAKLHQEAPRFARTIQPTDFRDDCAGMMPHVTPRTLTYHGDAPILVIGGKNDPATPYRWAEEMTTAMGDSSTLVTFTGEGHGQLLASSCVTTLEGSTLTDLERPADGTVCDPDPAIEKPIWWDGLPVPDGIGDTYPDSALLGALGLSPSDAYSELRLTDLDPVEALSAYEAALRSAGFTPSGTQEPFTGAHQGIYVNKDGDVLSVVTLGSDAMASPELESVRNLLPTGKTLVILLYLKP